ncbi:putative quinol monooxygenase [Jiangella alba]|uniref:Antibiotic biosynthesis monooxygenase n=1 Tax=Jiangella alba TaxID=561176 RepID=A0A1H5C9G4_9ACTN|nr:antibiotic biosynthesis monooxygenase [Jiangella alba]SED63266.1 Antibiotic biosynthesis monooxygenase [Jiangella alba]
MIIVAGHLRVAAADREAYLATCVAVVELARAAEGCLDYALSADVVDPERINVFERWASRAALDAFRGDGAGDEQVALLTGADVREFTASDETRL